MVWLAQRGYRVRGVELSPLAVESFFAESGLQPKHESVGEFERWSAGPYELYCGDIFELERLDNVAVDAVYDRASLVALNPLQRGHYARLLRRALPAGCPMLLVAMDYPQHEMTGPPFSVDQQEVKRLYGADYQVELLHSLDLLQESQRYRDHGLSRLIEQVYHLKPMA
jgi:thiopurine S-methyltransferase